MPVDGSHPDYAKVGALPLNHFVNPIGEGADPWVIRDPNNDRYLWCFSEGNRGISIHTSKNLTSFGQKHLVWEAPESGPYSKEVWAPELHYLNERWHIYFAASDGQNKNHLAYVLKSKTKDPLGEYDLHGPFQTGDTEEQNLWAIDMTPLQHEGKLYALWSGWDGPETDRQFLYIAEMASPTKLAGKRVRICDNLDYPWEKTEGGPNGRGLNEGPQILKNGKHTYLIYSCGASWLPSYKLGQLELTGDDPLDPTSWKKRKGSIFQSSKETFGVGHSCFVKSPDGSEWWHIFHAKRDPKPGWRRAIFVQPFKFHRDGRPLFGRPIPSGQIHPRPAGEKTSQLNPPYHSDLSSDHSFYGHHQFYQVTDDGLRMGSSQSKLINDYRSGEKIVLHDQAPQDFTASVTLDFHNNRKGRGAGLLFRVTAPSVGYDAHRGYFVGIKPSQNSVLFGKMDGSSWKELRRITLPIDVSKKHQLSVTGIGPEFTISLNGSQLLTHTDKDYQKGTIGLRVVDIPTTFSDLKVTKP